jgi:hypothetical protein
MGELAELLPSVPVKGKGNLEIMQILIPLSPGPYTACRNYLLYFPADRTDRSSTTKITKAFIIKVIL